MIKPISNFFLFLFFIFCFLSLIAPVKAQHFSSSNYIIEFGNFNITSGKKSSANYSLTDTVGQIAPGTYTSTGYKLKAGFQSIYDTFNQFSFSIDNLNIALGILVPNVGSTAVNIISISTPSGHGYDIYAQQNHPLSQDAGPTIPDTKCDSGTCTADLSGSWTSAGTYGFGFNAIGINSSSVATGIGTSDFFTDSTFYRPFATFPAGQIIMSEPVRTTNPNFRHSARISYKVNVSPAQAAGAYQNAIIFTAVPKY